MKYSTGPFIKIACFCDNVIEGKDGVLTLVRVVDNIKVQAQGSEAPDIMPPSTYNLKMVIMIVPGDAKGRHELKVEVEDPIGLRDVSQSFSVSTHLGEGQPANIVADFGFGFKQEGTYLFHVLLDGTHMTTMPLTVLYSRIVTGD